MPLLYGEGSRAFIRLQEEIIKTSHDHSLLCWAFKKNTPGHWNNILAPSPEEFENSGEYAPKERDEGLTPYAMTNLGLSIQLPVIHTLNHPLVLLNAGLRNSRSRHRACLPMKYGSANSVQNPILFRHWFPNGPINLETYDADRMRRHHFYISATAPYLFPFGDSHLSFIQCPKVLIVMQPTDSTLLRGSPPVAFQSSENSGLEVPYVRSPYIDTYPPDMFDKTRSILQLPTMEGKTGRVVNACAMSLSYPGESGQVLFLSFECRNFGDRKCEWGCKIMSLRRYDGMELLLRSFVHSDVWDGTERCSRLPDGSLILELGTSVPSGEGQSVQIATLRGPKQKSINIYGSDTLRYLYDSEEVSDTDSNGSPRRRLIVNSVDSCA